MSVRVVSLKFKAEDLQGIAPAQLYRVGLYDNTLKRNRVCLK